ncbi:aminotransferase class V-fold PLP-dependent enzyme [Kribbella sp. NPDC056861]|uniref:aminotransferase class V-fold PLP-dependent enzyme n=1 Tax=Kribbella sp. NPDC056861 TaxID=3154857 RepID=UPI00342CB168
MPETTILADLRHGEFGFLDGTGQVYLDYTGAALAPRSLVQAAADRIIDGYFGNPHSESPAAAASDRLVASARTAVLHHFHADPAEYAVIFTPNATGAMRVVGEAYPFGHGAGLVLTADNHNSVNGLREFARGRGAQTTYITFSDSDLRFSDDAVGETLRRGGGGLFAYPAQSNFTGVQHSLGWIEMAHQHGYDVLLDAAAFVPTNELDLSVVHPEFVAVSWYKVFGYPTGLGCLIARRDALDRLDRPWFAGGTIHVVSAQAQWHQMADDETAFEDGTLNFLGIPSVEDGLDWITKIGLEAVHDHVAGLTGLLLDGLLASAHSNGQPMVRIYGPRDAHRRGGTIALNLLDPAGRIVDERIVSRDSAAHSISLRTGCFCNPGAGEQAFAIATPDLIGAAGSGRGTIDDYLERLRLPSGGAVRVSVGIATNAADVRALLDFLCRTYRDQEPSIEGLPPRLRC